MASDKNNTNDTPGIKNSKVNKTRIMKDNICDNLVKLNLCYFFL